MVYSMDRVATSPTRAHTEATVRDLTPRTLMSSMATRMWTNEHEHRHSTHLQPARERGRPVSALHSPSAAAISTPIRCSTAAYANDLVTKARHGSSVAPGGMTPRSAIRARGERMEAGLRRWKEQQAEYMGHARRAVTPPPAHQPHGRPTHWLDYLCTDRDLGNKVARESVAAPDSRTSARPGVGAQRHPDGSFHVIRHIERGHCALERFRRGVPPNYGGFIPQHYSDASVARSSNNTIGWVEPEPPEAPIVRRDVQTGSHKAGARTSTTPRGTRGIKMGKYGPYLDTPRAAAAHRIVRV